MVEGAGMTGNSSGGKRVVVFGIGRRHPVLIRSVGQMDDVVRPAEAAVLELDMAVSA